MRSKSVLTTLVLVILGLGVGMIALLHSSPGSADSCPLSSGVSNNLRVMIMDGKVDNPAVQAKVCDTLTFENMDSEAREIAFGPHENHIAYDGVSERVLNQGQSFTITLDRTGSLHWHDHLHDSVEGNVIITNER